MSRLLEKAVNKILFECLNLQLGESLLVITDENNGKLGQLFLRKARAGKIESYLLKIPPVKLTEVDRSQIIRRFVVNTDAVIIATSPALVHSKIIAHACHNGRRVICLNSTDISILEKALNSDYSFVAHASQKIADIFSIGKIVEIKTRLGTDFTFRISRHKGNINHGCAKNAGEFGILPAGEAYVVPDKNSVNGIIIIDGSIPEIGLVHSPLKLYVKNGFVSQMSGNGIINEVRRRIKPFGKNGRNIAEFGLGTNPAVKLTGSSVVDEKKLGTAHIALGNHLFEGGSTANKLHLDMIFLKPTVVIDGRPLMISGKIVE